MASAARVCNSNLLDNRHVRRYLKVFIPNWVGMANYIIDRFVVHLFRPSYVSRLPQGFICAWRIASLHAEHNAHSPCICFLDLSLYTLFILDTLVRLFLFAWLLGYRCGFHVAC